MNRFTDNHEEGLKELAGKYKQLRDEIGKVIVGQDLVVRDTLIAIFSRSHALLVGVPGLAKTLLVNTISDALNLDFRRIQFTPDLMPSDITGSEILDEDRKFRFMKGPVFANVLLADEINRTPPKTQAALLEAMQERNVTIGGQNFNLPEPFFVLATQNPIEQEGTYPLPEAQLDRFMLNIVLTYPTLEEELDIVRNTTSGVEQQVNKMLTGEEITEFQQLIRQMPIADNVLQYIVMLVNKTRPASEHAPAQVKEMVSWGAGPRASQFLTIGAKCHAGFNGKFSPDIEDVQAIANSVLRHRVVKNFRAEAQNITTEGIIHELL